MAWLGGTIAGVAGAGAIGDPSRWGLDVLFPVFYLTLLLPELFPERGQGAHGRSTRPSWRPIIVSVMAAVITLVLTPIDSTRGAGARCGVCCIDRASGTASSGRRS